MMHHIQYPVGQGGFHLGIIGTYAYVYDCGGSNNVDWKQIFNDVTQKLKDVKTLDIFISHLHKDHYNKVSTLVSNVSCVGLKTTIYMPLMNEIEKLIIIGEYLRDNHYDKNYISMVITCRFVFDSLEINKYKQPEYKFINNTKKDISVLASDIILRTYVSNHMKADVDRFKHKLSELGIDIEHLEDRISDISFWQHIKDAFIEVFNKNNISNKIMLCLYCGKSFARLNYIYNNSNWLHTGDAYMNSKDLHGFFNRFGLLLNNVNFAQIPHHGSSHNHDRTFSMLFNSCRCKNFFYTYDNSSNVAKNVGDILLCCCQSIYEISDTSLTKIIK